jgi:molybdopterin synthase sulfur carrier subunit
MHVRIRVPTQLRDLVGGAAAVDVAVGDAVGGRGSATTTVGAVLDGLAAQHPALERRIRDELGRLRQHVNVFVGADNIRDRDGTDTTIGPGDELSVIPAVSGG